MTDLSDESGVVVLTRYETKVHASNRNADYGVPVVVFAENRRQAVDRAIDVGWAGERRNARVTIRNVEQITVVPPTPPEGSSS